MRISDWSSDVCSSDLRRAHQPRTRIDGEFIGARERPSGRAADDHLSIAALRAHIDVAARQRQREAFERSEEHTSELQSLMRISYAVFCLKKKTTKRRQTHT